MPEGVSGIPVVAMGLGHIGREIARAVLTKPELRLVAAVDPAYAGKRLDRVLGCPSPPLTVLSDPEKAFPQAAGGVVLQATVSEFETVLPQLEAAARAKLCVVSTCEELAWPWHHEGADDLDRLCEDNEVAVVGLGVNPGFVLDRLPALLSQATGAVAHVRARRVQDAARLRPALQSRLGIGLDEAAFNAAADRGDLGHVGLLESALLLAAGCGLDLEETEEQIHPVLARRDVDAGVPVKMGRVAGVQQVLRGFVDGVERVHLELVVAADVGEAVDEIEIDAQPPVSAVLRGGLPGDLATACAVVNAAPAITMMDAGLVTVLDLPSGRM